jgi:uncharacterized protein (TIGR02246 family)
MQKTQTTEATRQIVDQLIAAFNSQDANRMLAAMSDDVIFENTGPAPDGTRYKGKNEARAFWEQFFADSPNATIEIEDMFVAEDRAAVTHWYSWASAPRGDDPGYVRGATIFRVRDGKVVEMYPYVKG